MSSSVWISKSNERESVSPSSSSGLLSAPLCPAQCPVRSSTTQASSCSETQASGNYVDGRSSLHGTVPPAEHRGGDRHRNIAPGGIRQLFHSSCVVAHASNDIGGALSAFAASLRALRNECICQGARAEDLSVPRLYLHQAWRAASAGGGRVSGLHKCRDCSRASSVHVCVQR